MTGTPLDDVGEGALPLPAQTASDEEITASHAADLTEYLKRMTGGVFVNDIQNNPLQPDINYRGFQASPVTGVPQGLAVYQNGVRINEAFGDTVNLDLIPPSAIQRIDVVTSNPVFGLNALGGAINMVTPNGRTAAARRRRERAGSRRGSNRPIRRCRLAAGSGLSARSG